MEMFKVHKIHCLICDKIIETNDDVVSCGCKNETTLNNQFTLSRPNSTISALDKTKTKGQLLYDIDGLGKTGDWFFIREPETESTSEHTRWKGQLGGNTPGFLAGKVVEFTTPLMTSNECRQFLKTNYVTDKETDGQIYHLWYPIE